MGACVVALDLLHDAWFYWTHRLLHWRPLYRYVHWEHHRWVRGAPAPLTHREVSVLLPHLATLGWSVPCLRCLSSVGC